MGFLALFLTLVVILPCLITANIKHHSVKHLTGLEQFKPPHQGCKVNLIVESIQTCPWCDEMANHLFALLVNNYVPVLEYTPQSLIKRTQVATMEKGTCFANWLIIDNFNGLQHIFNDRQLSRINTKNWFVYIKVLHGVL